MAKQPENIKEKLRRVILMTSGTVLLLTVFSFVTYDLLYFRRAMIEYTKTLGEMIAANASSSLTFDDENDATQVLSTLRVEPYVELGALYKDGKIFAHFPTNAPSLAAIPLLPPKEGVRFDGRKIILVRPVINERKQIGTLFVQADIEPMFARIRIYAWIVLAVLIGSLFVAYVLAFNLQRRISGPVLALADAAKRVSESRDFSIRATKVSQDEIGALTDSFNQMLDQIQERSSALRESSERLRLALQASQTATWDWEIATNKITWDDFHPRLFGIKPGEFKGDYDSFLQLIHPEDRPMAEQVFKRALKERREFSIDFRVLSPDGQVRYMSSRGKAFYDETGAPVRMTGVTLDVTESKKAEQAVRESEKRFRTMADAAPVLIWTAGVNRQFDYFNRSWLEFTGRTFEQELGNGWMQDVHPDDAINFSKMYFSAFENRAPFSIDFRLRRRDGEYRWLQNRGAPRFAPDGSFQGFIGSAVDITETKLATTELERRVQDRTAELQNSNRELEAFTYSVSHDLRAPLRHVDGYAQILQEDFAGELPEEAKKYLDRIRHGTQNMGELVDDLLNLARVGRQELATEDCELNALVEEVIDQLKEETQERKITWKISRLPRVKCDPGLVKQVFTNLISNAVKYTRPRAEAIIEVGAEQMNGNTVFFVRDNGVGFNMKYSNKLFGVFQRLHRADEFEGTGVGLATVERIIRKHGGRIWPEAELDKGAAFYFTLGTILEQETRPNSQKS